MINRVLIRIKVVQLLYSYLLVENQFNLESQPESPTKEKRFSYGLYLDMLLLMVRISHGIRQRGGGEPLASTRFIMRTESDDKIRSLSNRYRMSGFPFADVEKSLTEEVKSSALYKHFLKSDNPGSIADEKIWEDIFRIIIMGNPEVNAIISRMENFTLSGVERMQEMMQRTFKAFFASGDHLPDALASLRESLNKARELYFRLLALPIALTDLREREIDENRKKYILTDEDRNPNLRFVENQLVEKLRANERIEKYLKDHKAEWSLRDDDTLLNALLKAIMASDTYQEYMAFPATDFAMDCELWRNLFKHVIFDNPDFLEWLEDKSVFWNDDVDIIGTFMLKTLRRFENSDSDPIMDQFKDDEDARFGAELFSKVVANKDEYRTIIDNAIDKSAWETERMAFMDIVIVMTAIAEILNFPKVPLTVSVNEYIEIAKAYSTGKSGQFVHGLLAEIIDMLRADGKLIGK